MNDLRQRIMAEVESLRALKRSVFSDGFRRCDLEASNICLSADILLVPLYWLWKERFPGDTSLGVEGYLTDAVDAFEAKSGELIPRLMARTEQLDGRLPSRPFESYRRLLAECLRETVENRGGPPSP